MLAAVLGAGRAACFARAVVAAARPHARERAKNLLWAVAPQLAPADAPLPRERAKALYSPAEIDGYLALADAQPTAARRMRATALVCLGAGAGLIRGNLRQVRGSDVACRCGCVIVEVRGARPRTVPVLARYHKPLLRHVKTSYVSPRGRMISIGRLEARDRAAWEQLFAGYHAFYGRPSWPLENYDQAWSRFELDDQIHARGARVDGRLVGIVHFLVHASTTSADVCYLQDLFTAPEARGKGVARALIAEVERWAREQGCARVYWHTQSSNNTARHLYVLTIT